MSVYRLCLKIRKIFDAQGDHMNTKTLNFRPHWKLWAILLLGLIFSGFVSPRPSEASFSLEMLAGTSGFNWTAFPIESTQSFTNMGNKSLRIDTSDRPRVVYGGEGLFYATWTGSVWEIKTADNSAGVGQYASLALDSSNQAYISYYDAENEDLKYAKWNNSSNSWTVLTLDGEDIVNSKEEEVGGFTSIDLDSSNRPQIVYFDDTRDDLMYIRWTGSEWDDPETIDSEGVVGLYASMYIDADNDVHVSYYDFTNKSLKYAVREDGDWDVSTVDNPTDEVVGKYSSIDVDFLGFPHISYFDETNEELKYA
jgi:hypothetical protein